MNLEDITLNYMSQSHKDKYCMIPFMWVVKITATESRTVVARGWGRETAELVFNMYGVLGIGGSESHITTQMYLV